MRHVRGNERIVGFGAALGGPFGEHIRRLLCVPDTCQAC